MVKIVFIMLQKQDLQWIKKQLFFSSLLKLQAHCVGNVFLLLMNEI